MIMKLRFILNAVIGLLLFSLYVGCNSNQPVEQPVTQIKQPDWSKTDPLAFLNILRKHPNLRALIVPAPPDWIKEEHVSQLMQLIDSQEPAAIVVSGLSSSWPRKGDVSTIGNEVLFLIEGFRKGHYPPSLSSLSYLEYDREKVRKWWREYQKKKSEDKKDK